MTGHRDPTECPDLLANISGREFATAFLETAHEPLMVLDGNLRVKCANRPFYQSFHLSPEEIEGNAIYDLAGGRWGVPELQRLFDRILHEKKPINEYLITIDFREVGERNLLVNAHPVFAHKDSPEALILSIKDITEHNYHVEEERKRRLNQTTHYVKDLEEATEQLRFQAEKQAVQKEALHAAREKLEECGHQRTSELIHLTQALQEEITQHEQTEKQLKRYAAKLEWSNRELEDFARVASHDLQEPLRKIRAFGDRLKARYADALGNPGRDYLERMQDAANRMQALITALLTYSRVTTQAERFLPVNLGDVAHEVLSNLEARLEETDAQVEVGDLPTIEADRSQMVQLLQNLVGNALKFHRENEPPRVKVHGEAVEDPGRPPPAGVSNGDWCRIHVQDNGIGFDEQYLDRIFVPFQRLHGRDRYEGTGIGLAICRKIVERHGGSITARSTPGDGSTFTVALPVKRLPMRVDW
jgi:signal transduction histidine kinase